MIDPSLHQDSIIHNLVKVLSLPETIQEKIDVSSEGPSSGVSSDNSRRRAFARNVDFSFIVSGSEITFTFRVSLNTLPTLATLVRDNSQLASSLSILPFFIQSPVKQYKTYPQPQYSEWAVVPLSSATCPPMSLQFTSCHQPVQGCYLLENGIDWLREC